MAAPTLSAAAEDGDVKAIWTVSAIADLERLTGPSNQPR
jgi:hypothetical protein